MPGTFLPMLPAPTQPPKPQRPLARGTPTALVQNRRIRLHPVGDRPWEGDADDHRQRINVEQHGDTFVVFKPAVGAISALNTRDYLSFNVFIAAGGDRTALARHFVQLGETPRGAAFRAERLAAKLERDGWLRTELPVVPDAPLRALYFTVTRYCDLTCPYCYQGLNDRYNTEMSIDDVRQTLQRIKAVNPNCRINISGGEPFSHSRIHDILDLVDAHGFPFIILSNGGLIDDRAAEHLRRLERFLFIQISLDGASAETHEMTRGKGHFPKVMAGIQRIIDQRLPFKLAPTLHNKNMHELTTIAELALANGGWMSPNQLKELPHAGLDYNELALNSDAMLQALTQCNEHLIGKFGLAAVVETSQRYASWDPEVCSVTEPNSTFICGMAHSVMDIDWNGDVYPCHLSKGPDLLIGNIFREDFPAIFQRVDERGIRVKSNEIEKCSGCKFGSTCAGGCRAGAWFTFGTLEHTDELCDSNYRSHLDRLLVGAAVS